ncbi:MAG: Na+:solute symporter [Bacteroidales bacterium]|nr:Na+:solute symporter [Bacteroidales bacterium]
MFNSLDYLEIALFFVILLLIPAIAAIRSRGKGANEYFKSAGSMPWWLIGISMVAATTSTNSANLFTEIIRRDGLSGNWTWWAFLLTGMLTVFIYSKLWVRSGATTDISFYELRYSGKPAAFLRGFRALYLGVIYNLVVMATVLLGAIKIGVVLFGVPAYVILIVTGVVSFIYSCLSGIRGTIYTDFFLFTVVMIGACVVMYFGVHHPAVGGWANLMSSPDVSSRLSFFPDFSDTDALIAIFIIPVAVQWWNVWYSGSEPGGGGYIVQRVLTAKSPNHAVGGTLFFNILNYALRPWPWYIAAFASILIFPNLDSIAAALPGVDPALIKDDMAYPALIRTVPNGWVGLVAASLMGALFSTIAAHISMGANYVSNDIWKRFIHKEAGDREMIWVARASSLILVVAGCSLAPFIGSAKSGFDLMVQIGAGTGVIFLLRWFWMRINAWTEIVAMIVSFLAAVFFQLVWPHISSEPLLFWEKLLWTIAVTTVCWLVATFLTRPEKPEVIANFKSLVRADGRDVGKGLLKMFFASIAIFALMWGIGKLITL